MVAIRQEADVQDRLDTLKLLLSAFGTSSFAGLAALLRSGKPVTVHSVLSAMLNSGLMGLGMFLVLYKHFEDNILLLVGTCILSGLGGMTLLDFCIELTKKGGVEIHISPRAGDSHDEPPKLP